MYEIQRKTRKFFTDLGDDMKDYDAILTDPLCTVLNSWREKQIDSEYDEGRLTGTKTKLVLVLTWEEKRLL